MQVFGSLEDLRLTLRQRAEQFRTQAENQQDSTQGRKEKSRLFAVAYGMMEGVEALDNLKLDSPSLFKIVTEWGKAHKTVGTDASGAVTTYHTARELIAGFDPELLETSKPWIVEEDGERFYYMTAAEAAQNDAVICGRAVIRANITEPF